jgi:prophage regulatory protein
MKTLSTLGSTVSRLPICLDVGQTSTVRRRRSPLPNVELSRDAHSLPEPLTPLPASAVLLRCPEVMKRVALSRTALYALMREGKFPAPIKLGTASAWVDFEITRWMERQMAVRDQSLVAR